MDEKFTQGKIFTNTILDTFNLGRFIVISGTFCGGVF